MNATDTLALSQHLNDLDKPALRQAASSLAAQATTLATQNAQQASQLAQLGDWVKNTVPKYINRPARVGIAVTTGLGVGVAYGTLPHPWALVASFSAAAASAVAAGMAKDPDWKDAALAVTAGAASTALGLEAAKFSSEFMAKRAAAKGTAVAATAPAPTGAKKA